MLLIWTPKTVSYAAKKLYDLLLSVNRTVSAFSITIFDTVVTVAQWFFYKNECFISQWKLLVVVETCFVLVQKMYFSFTYLYKNCVDI